MRPFARAILALLAVVMAFGSVNSATVLAADYPARTITLIVPYPPGGGVDAMARVVADKLTEALKQQVIVENRGGANHVIGAAMVAKAVPDGHTMMVGAETVFVINPTLHAGKLPRRSFAGVESFAVWRCAPRVLRGLKGHPHNGE